jgi:hypothetical protein
MRRASERVDPHQCPSATPNDARRSKTEDIMMRSRVTAAALATALALAMPATLLAQPAGPPPDQSTDQGPGWGWGPGAMMGWFYGMMQDWDDYRGPMMGRGGFGRGMMGGPTQFVEGRIAFLEAELKITDAQKPLFDAFATTLRDSAASMEPMHQRMWSRDIPESLPERLQWHIDEMSSRLSAMETVKAAALPLYDALSPEQKTAADRLFWPMGMM